jgi:hypothetical protein
MIYYFTDDADIAGATTPDGIERALNLFGAWSDLDWDEAEAELDRIGHTNPPTPPITL